MEELNPTSLAHRLDQMTASAAAERIARLEADLRAGLDIAEASARQCARLRASNTAMRRALEAMVTTEEEDPCWYDHNGNCQAHGVQPKGECYMELARAALAPEEPQEK